MNPFALSVRCPINEWKATESLKKNSDGSLTLYFQNASPGAEKESNWAAGAEDDFLLYIRADWPKAEIQEGKWLPPPVSRMP